MRTIKVKFCDCIWGKSPKDTLIYKLLSQHYNIEFSEEPDYLFSGGRGNDHWKSPSKCVKIVTIGENVVPDFNAFDYAIGFDYLSFPDRYCRIPLYVFYDNYELLKKKHNQEISFSDDFLLNRAFCSMVVSNNIHASPMRETFFHELSKYKPVSSGGRFMNNIGKPNGVEDKETFCKGFKFNIAFENSSSPGYTTEKILQPLSWGVMPIYWGNPYIEQEFSSDCFIHVKDEKDIKASIEKIVALDNDDMSYLKSINTPPFATDKQLSYHEELLSFLLHIIEQPLSNAKRINQYGQQGSLYRDQVSLHTHRNLSTKILRFLKRKLKV